MAGGPVFLRPQRLVYVRAVGPYETSIPQAWSKLLGWIDKCGYSNVARSWYGLARDNPYTAGREQCRYDACVPVDPMIEERALRELGLTSLPGGPHARHKHMSGQGDLIEQLGAFYCTYAPENGLDFDLRRPVVTIYMTDPRGKDAASLRADLCVPLATAAANGRIAA